MAVVWNGTDLTSAYGFEVQEFDPPIHKKTITVSPVPGVDGARPVGARFEPAEFSIKGIFSGAGHNFANFKAFENALLNSLKVFSDYVSTTVGSGSTLQVTSVSSDIYTECFVQNIKVIKYKKTGSLAVPLEIEIYIIKTRPGVQ